MTPTKIERERLLEALNAGPGEPRRDVAHAVDTFGISERTVYRRIKEFRIRQRCRWELEDAA